MSERASITYPHLAQTRTAYRPPSKAENTDFSGSRVLCRCARARSQVHQRELRYDRCKIAAIGISKISFLEPFPE